MDLYQHDRILFLGDSITDCGRDYTSPENLGKGFPYMLAARLEAAYPSGAFHYLNRGISGNKIENILNRMQEDCLTLQPDVLIFLIGINDTWHNVGQPSFGKKSEATRFENAYRSFLEQVTQHHISRILLLEPFLLPYPEDRKEWRLDLDQKIQSIRTLAREFNCEYLPLDGIFAEKAIATAPQQYTGDDGVHPTIAGNGVITQEIFKRCTYKA